MKPWITATLLVASFALSQNASKAQSIGYAGDIVFFSDGPYIRVHQVFLGSLAESMGLRAGDLIGRINGFAPQSQEVILKATLSQNGDVVLDVVRSNRYIRLRGRMRFVRPDGSPSTRESTALRGAITGDDYLEAAASLNRSQNLAILRKLGIRVRSDTHNAITRIVIDRIDMTGLAYQGEFRNPDGFGQTNLISHVSYLGSSSSTSFKD